MKSIENCSICASTHMTPLWELPGLPLSETYGNFDPQLEAFDQTLMICDHCGHVQLYHQLSPQLLYGDNYHFQTSQSHSTKVRLNSFQNFVLNNVEHDISTVIDIGGNDDSLLSLFNATQKYLVDPSAKKTGKVRDVEYIRAYVEEVDLSQFQNGTILCTHTLEHIPEPADLINTLLQNALPEQRFFFEVPCFKKQIENGRLDAIFHQHYHYFYPETIETLICNAGGKVIAIDYNEYPTCGGSLMVAFMKGASSPKTMPIDNDKLVSEFLEAKYKFESFNQDVSDFIDAHNPVYGFAASLLLPVIFYHIGESSRKIHTILDDDELKDGTGYRNLEGVKIKKATGIDLEPNSGVIITSYENYQTLQTLLPGRFNTPIFTGELK